jgi:MFS family permease
MVYQTNNVYFICSFAAIGEFFDLARSKCFAALYPTDLLTCPGGGLFGFDISSMAGVLGTQAYKRYFHNPRSYGQGAITAAMPFGSLVGALASSFIADKYSRKIAIQIASVIWIIGSM